MATTYDPGTAGRLEFLRPNLLACASWRSTGTEYVLDLAAATCTCPDFLHRQSKIEGGRCKHLRQVLETPAAPLERPAIGTSVKVWGPTTDEEARALIAAQQGQVAA